MELLVAIDELVRAERSSWRYQEKVRVDREALRSALARLRMAMITTLPNVAAPELAGPVDRLERMCADGTVRGGRVKVNLEAMGDALDEARQLAVADIRRQQGL